MDLAEIRKEKKVTQEQLAQQIGVTQQAISKYERHIGYPSLKMAFKMATALKVKSSDIIDIFYNEDEI
jgi:DNA-binding XRE family transcriptional regulator